MPSIETNCKVLAADDAIEPVGLATGLFVLADLITGHSALDQSYRPGQGPHDPSHWKRARYPEFMFIVPMRIDRSDWHFEASRVTSL